MRMGAVRRPTQVETKVAQPKPKATLSEINIEEKEVVEATPVAEEVKAEEWGTLSSITISKLKKGGYTSITDFAGLSKEELVAIDGIGEKVADKILEFNA